MRYLISILIILIITTNTFAYETSSPLTDREIIESLVELKEGQKRLDNRIEDLAKRIDDMGKRIDNMESNMGKRIDDLRSLLYVILGGIFTLVGFVIWDRRTALAPAIKKNRMLEDALVEYSENHPDMKEILKRIGLL